VHVGSAVEIVDQIGPVSYVIANCMKMANVVLEMQQRALPVIWIIHEWWPNDEHIRAQCAARSCRVSPQTIQAALHSGARIVCVSVGQRQLYGLQEEATVIYNGLPDPVTNSKPPKRVASADARSLVQENQPCSNEPLVSMQGMIKPFTLLCAGSIGPRKNQARAVELFQRFAVDKGIAVQLHIVGARYIRPQEIAYVEKLKSLIGTDDRIKIIDATEDMAQYYRRANALLCTSSNEVTPMVIAEAMAWSIPILSTDLAGIREMVTDGREGCLFSLADDSTPIWAMERLYADASYREQLGYQARQRFETQFHIDDMVRQYQVVAAQIVATVILLDMDGVLADWDGGCRLAWGERTAIDRTASYYMERCIPEDAVSQADAQCLMLSAGFFRGLAPIPGAIRAAKAMRAAGYEVFLCTNPLAHSRHCVQEKLDWVGEHLGDEWRDRVILTNNKFLVAGDVLVDDKPFATLPRGKNMPPPSWKQIVFDAPYNRHLGGEANGVARIVSWGEEEWRPCLERLIRLGAVTDDAGL
jgi:5'-nucleotidase